METNRRGIEPGMMVRDRLGEKVGKVRECSADTFLIEKGLLSHKDYVARYDQVLDVREGEVWLTKTAAEFGQLGGERLGTEAGRTAGREEVRVPLAEEELEATKRVRSAGEVKVHKDVVTEQKQISVPVTHERVVVERTPVTGAEAARPGEARFSKDTISIPVQEEEVEIRKRPVVREEVKVRKERGVQEQRFAESVRKETAEVEDETGKVTRTPSEPGGYKAPGGKD